MSSYVFGESVKTLAVVVDIIINYYTYVEFQIIPDSYTIL